MKQSHVSLETTKLAKEKGFNLNCRYQFMQSSEGGYDAEAFSWTLESGGSVDNDDESLLHAPSQAVLQKWIREEHEMHVEIYANASGWGWLLTKTQGNGSTIKEIEDDMFHSTYEEALEVGLRHALKRLKNTN